MNSFWIPKYRISELEEKLERLLMLEKRLGVAETITFLVTGDEETRAINEDGREKIVWALVKVEGEAPVIDGWEFAATIQHTEAGNIIRTSPTFDGDVPEAFRTTGQWCDHCATKRDRIDTFLVTDGSAWKQLGRSCLKHYMGHVSPVDLVAYMTVIRAMKELGVMPDENALRGGHKYMGMDAQEFMATCAAVIEECGWTSRTDARESYGQKVATADLALAQWETALLPTDKIATLNRHRDLAEKALTWGASLDDPGNDYLYNVSVLCNLGYVEVRNVGLAASIIPAYNRCVTQERLRKLESENSQHFGIVKKRDDFVLTFVGTPWSTEGQYGPRHLHKFVDENGNIATWTTGKTYFETVDKNDTYVLHYFVEGHTYNVRATVKAHNEFRGVAQTELSRCKF